MAKKNFLRDLWALLQPYWKSEERGRAWLLLLVNVALILATVYMTVLRSKSPPRQRRETTRRSNDKIELQRSRNTLKARGGYQLRI